MIYLQPSQWNSDDSIDAYALQMPTGQYIMDSANQPWSFSSPDNTTLRFEVRAGDHWSQDVAGSERDEIAGTSQYAVGTPIDVSYKFMIEPGAANTASWLVVGQLHQNDFAGETANTPPPLSIMMIGERIAVRVGYTDGAGVNRYQTIYVAPADIVRGQYYNMNIAATFNPAGGGQVAVSCNGQTLATYSGPLGIAGHASVFWKEGIYEAVSAQTLAVDYANLNIATGTPAPAASASTAAASSSAATTLLTTAYSYAANNVVATKTITNLDQSQDIYNFNTTGPYYVAAHLHYNPSGTLTQTVDYNSNGSRAYAQTLNSDGSTSTQNYDGSGNLLKSAAVYANGIISTLTYANNALAEKFIQYVDGSSMETDYSASGALAKQIQINADGSKIAEVFGLTGQNYVSQTTQYNAAGTIVSVTRANAAGYTVFAQTSNATATITTNSTALGILASVVTNFATGVVLTQTYANGALANSFTKNPDGSTLNINFNGAGAVTNETQTNADGSKAVQTFGIVGQTYVAETDDYNSAGQLTSLVRVNSAGLPVFSQTVNGAGTTTVDQYTPAGALVETVATASNGVQTMNWFAAGGNMTAAEALQPGGSYAYDAYNSAGALTQEIDSLPGVSLTSHKYNGATNADGSAQYVKSVTAYESGLAFASDGINDTFNSFGGDTFSFASGFGTDVVNNFHAAGANQDLIALSSAIVPGFSSLAIRQSGADTLLTIDPTDSIRLSGVTAASFTAADVRFM